MSEFLVKVSKTLAWPAERLYYDSGSVGWWFRRFPESRPAIVVDYSFVGTSLIYKTFHEIHEMRSIKHMLRNRLADHPLVAEIESAVPGQHMFFCRYGKKHRLGVFTGVRG